MKRLRMFALGLLSASAVMMTSCADDPDPLAPKPNLDITVLTSDGQTVDNGDVTVTTGTSITFAINAVKTGTSDLDVFQITRGGSLSISPLPKTDKGYDYDSGSENLKNGDDETYRDTLRLSGTVFTTGEINFEFSVTNKDGQTTTRTIKVTVGTATVNLTAAQSFQWMRVAGANGTGLDQFGLKWTSNNSTSAIVKKDQAVKLVNLSGSDQFTAITTVAGLSAAVDTGTDLADYQGISATDPSKTYSNEYLGVKYNGEYYLINVKSSTVSTAGGGTTITVDGEFKSTN